MDGFTWASLSCYLLSVIFALYIGFMYLLKSKCFAYHEWVMGKKWEELDFYKGFPDWDFTEWDRAKIEKFAKENTLTINDDVKEWLDDIDYFVQTKKLRRPDAWQHGWQL